MNSLFRRKSYLKKKLQRNPDDTTLYKLKNVEYYIQHNEISIDNLVSLQEYIENLILMQIPSLTDVMYDVNLCDNDDNDENFEMTIIDKMDIDIL